MKKLIFLLFVALALHSTAQKSIPATDTAEAIVNRYMDLLNVQSIRPDSILYMETYIYYRSTPHDTAILKRWYLNPNKFRCELWHGDTLIEGLYSDSRTVFKEFSRKVSEKWVNVTDDRFYTMLRAYEFRSPLYNWKANGSTMKYEGRVKFQQNDVYRVLMETPNIYNRHLLFEPESGLLFLIEETSKHSEYTNHAAYEHADWHAFHEYQPVGTVLLPSVESYQMGNDVLFYFTHFDYIPVNMDFFTKD